MDDHGVPACGQQRAAVLRPPVRSVRPAESVRHQLRHHHRGRTRRAAVDFEIIEPDDSDWVSPSSIDNAGKPSSVENPARRKDKIVCEISNPNDFDIDSAAVIVFFRDESGKLLAGETT